MDCLNSALAAVDTASFNHAHGMTCTEEDAANKARLSYISDIVYAIRHSKFPMSDFIEENFEFADQVHAIICDDEDDKMGRINDLHYTLINEFAEFLVDHIDSYLTVGYLKKLGLQ